MRPHRSDNKLCAAGQFGFCQRVVDQALWLAAEQCHTFIQRRLEIQLAAHGAFGNRNDRLGKAGDARHVVKGFGGDDCAVHIGEQQPLAATGGRQDVDIGAAFADVIPEPGQRSRIIFADWYVPCSAGMKPPGAGCIAPDAGGGKTCHPVVNREAASF